MPPDRGPTITTTRPAAPRSFTRLAIAGLAGHVFFELGAGVGMPGASIIGPVPAATAWTAVLTNAWRAAGEAPPSRDRYFTVLNGAGLAAVIGHLSAWPRRTSRIPLPLLAECEGMERALMRYYNPILYVSAVAAMLGVVRENRSAAWWWPLVPLPLAVPAAKLQHREYRRLLRRAQQAPAWWNRRLAARVAQTVATTTVGEPPGWAWCRSRVSAGRALGGWDPPRA